jgi:hypothetical protein
MDEAVVRSIPKQVPAMAIAGVDSSAANDGGAVFGKPQERQSTDPRKGFADGEDGGVGKGDVKHKRVLISHSQERASTRWKVRGEAARRLVEPQGGQR